MIEIVKDIDLFGEVDKYDVTLIGTNLYMSMGHGIQLDVMLNYPYVQEKNMLTKYGDNNKLGTILECSSENEPTFVLCYITKGYNFRPDIQKDYLEYDALEKCLMLANVMYAGKNVCSPMLGASRFDGLGDKERIMEIYHRSIKDFNLTIYDYEQKSRGEKLAEIRRRELEVKEKDYDEYRRMVAERKRIAEIRYNKNGHRRY